MLKNTYTYKLDKWHFTINRFFFSILLCYKTSEMYLLNFTLKANLRPVVIHRLTTLWYSLTKIK